MLITIKTLSGRKVSLDFEPNQKIKEIKNALHKTEGFPVDEIRLILNGVNLKNELTIQDADIKPGTILMMMGPPKIG